MDMPSLSDILKENKLNMYPEAMEMPYIGASQKKLVMGLPGRMFDWDERTWDSEILGADIDTFREGLEDSLQARFIRPISAMNGPIYLEKPTLDAFNALHMHLSPLTNPDFMKDSWIMRSGDILLVSALQKRDGYFMLRHF